jgi:hypothetical protein
MLFCFSTIVIWFPELVMLPWPETIRPPVGSAPGLSAIAGKIGFKTSEIVTTKQITPRKRPLQHFARRANVRFALPWTEESLRFI